MCPDSVRTNQPFFECYHVAQPRLAALPPAIVRCSVTHCNACCACFMEQTFTSPTTFTAPRRSQNNKQEPAKDLATSLCHIRTAFGSARECTMLHQYCGLIPVEMDSYANRHADKMDVALSKRAQTLLIQVGWMLISVGKKGNTWELKVGNC